MTKKYIAIIYEGEKTERQLVNNLNKVFFSNVSELVLIMFPAGENIYMLWKQLKEDDFQTDLIEVIRDYSADAKRVLEGYQRKDFMEIYLFFDYDGHQKNLSNREDGIDVIEEMLETFCEETELGKLYINYPMVESLRDHLPAEEEYCYRRCSIDISDIGTYKHKVHEMKEYQDFRKLTEEKWKDLSKNSVRKLNCVVNGEYAIPEREKYFEELKQIDLYEAQKNKYISVDKIAVINSFPLFLLDYFKYDFWKKMTA